MKKKISKFFKNLKFVKRELLVFLLFVLFFLIIVWKVFSYTVVSYDYYKDLADKQQIGKVEIPVTRGNIYTKNGSTLATSVSLNDLAIDPMGIGDKSKLVLFLTDIISNELCSNNRVSCESNLSKFLRVLDLYDFQYNYEYIKKKVSQRIESRLLETRITSVLLSDDISEQDSVLIRSLGIKGVYINKNNLYVNPEEIVNKRDVALKLSSIIPIIETKIEYMIRKRDKRYIKLLSKLSIESSEKIETYLKDEKDAFKRGIINEKDGIFNFLILTPYPQRYYPENTLASHIVGFVDSSGRGQYGMEGYFNDILKGNKGYIIAKTDIRGRTIDPISLKSGDLFGKGAKIYSTIDRNVQNRIESILKNGVKRFRANKGTVVVINPQTGEIVSMANYPTFNPNNPGDVYELEKVNYGDYPDPLIDLKGIPVFVEDSLGGKQFFYNSKKIFLREATEIELGNPAIIKYKYANNIGPDVYRNGAISDLYEPGSIMKSLTVAIGLDAGEISEYSMYQDNGTLTIDQFEISNVSSKCLGYHSFGHALNYSCNVGMIRIAQRYGRVLAYNYLKSFGFEKSTGVSLAGEVTSQIRELNHWSVSNLLTSSYGLGISVTPLQMATAYSILANGGVYVKPHIIDTIEYGDKKTLKYKTEKKYRVISPETSRIITKMLVKSMNDGVAQTGNVESYSLAGKTGTSQIASKGKYEEGDASTYASFAGYGPSEDPKFVIIVKLDRPRTSQFGGQTSAEIFRDISEYLLDYYKIPKKK